MGVGGELEERFRNTHPTTKPTWLQGERKGSGTSKLSDARGARRFRHRNKDLSLEKYKGTCSIERVLANQTMQA